MECVDCKREITGFLTNPRGPGLGTMVLGKEGSVALCAECRAKYPSSEAADARLEALLVRLRN